LPDLVRVNAVLVGDMAARLALYVVVLFDLQRGSGKSHGTVFILFEDFDQVGQVSVVVELV